ncbi:MAG: Tex family protein [Anaerolineales bacterium]
MTYAQRIATELNIRLSQAEATIALLDEGSTIPFIARYRKEATGTLDEEQIRQIREWIERLRALDERRTAIVKSIEEQGKLTPELHAQLDSAETLTALEDLYAPYKPRRRTRASIARERGLQPLADLILGQATPAESLETLAAAYLSDEVTDAEEAWQGARDIVAEVMSDHPEVRRVTREKAMQFGAARSEKLEDAEDPQRLYELYYDFEFRVDKLKPHQILALNRGEAEKVLRVKVVVPERDWQNAISAAFPVNRTSPFASHLQTAAADAAERLLLPAIERDVRRALTEQAEAHAIRVFGENLRSLLSAPPLAGHVTLGIDPGFRTGCKVAVVDATGKLLDTATIYPHEPQKRWDEALKTLRELINRHKVTLITIGNGTASRETEKLAAELTRGTAAVRYLIVSEAGASVYSASTLARAELPDLDVSLRGAVSIARRAQDPMAELVKIDPKAIGVGMYQHDVDQKELSNALGGVVESVVNRVGVDVNTASPALLTYVSGIGPKLAEKIVAHRELMGAFGSRADLRAVNGLGPKAFEQAAGFLRINNGSEPLDATAIHPESYTAARKILEMAEISALASAPERRLALAKLQQQIPLETLATQIGVGIPTLRDILEQLARPGRDPRSDAPPPILRSDVLSLEDLKPGMTLKGTVRNVIDFGAFVDLGVKHDGLLHISQIPRGTVLRAGEVIQVSILQIEAERGRIKLGWVK